MFAIGDELLCINPSEADNYSADGLHLHQIWIYCGLREDNPTQIYVRPKQDPGGFKYYVNPRNFILNKKFEIGDKIQFCKEKGIIEKIDKYGLVVDFSGQKEFFNLNGTYKFFNKGLQAI